MDMQDGQSALTSDQTTNKQTMFEQENRKHLSIMLEWILMKKFSPNPKTTTV